MCDKGYSLEHWSQYFRGLVPMLLRGSFPTSTHPSRTEFYKVVSTVSIREKLHLKTAWDHSNPRQVPPSRCGRLEPSIGTKSKNSVFSSLPLLIPALSCLLTISQVKVLGLSVWAGKFVVGSYRCVPVSFLHGGIRKFTTFHCVWYKTASEMERGSVKHDCGAGLPLNS